MKEKILITGGLGYIGSKFSELFYSDFDLKIVDTNFYNSTPLKNVETLFKDIRHLEIKDLEDIDYVIHMAELSNDPLGEVIPEITNEINHLATVNLLNLCKESNIKKFIYMSSCSVYGKNPELVHEESTLNPITNYSKAKVKNEKYMASEIFPFETVILRNATVFGYARNFRLDLVINDLTYSAYQFGKITLLSDGTPKRPFIHVVDLCRLLKLFLDSDNKFENEVFNVGSDELNFSIYEVSKIIQHTLKVKDVAIGKKDYDQRSYFVDFTKLKNIFPDFKFKYKLENGINDMIENFKGFEYDESSIRVKYLSKQLENKKLNNKLLWTE